MSFFFSKSDNLSKIAIYKLYMEVEVLGLVSVRPPQGDLAIIVRIYGHRGLYDFV